jgi:hypothetical protein
VPAFRLLFVNLDSAISPGMILGSLLRIKRRPSLGWSLQRSSLSVASMPRKSPSSSASSATSAYPRRERSPLGASDSSSLVLGFDDAPRVSASCDSQHPWHEALAQKPITRFTRKIPALDRTPRRRNST